MHGGVGGGGRKADPYPDLPTARSNELDLTGSRWSMSCAKAKTKAARALHRAALETNCRLASGSIRHTDNGRARVTFQGR
jgi:hypothetical protein